MARIRPQGSLSWTASESADVLHYRVYQGADGNPPTYDSPFVDIENVTTAQLPIAGLPAAEGSVIFGITAFDATGNESDIQIAAAILIDVTPPAPPTGIIYNPDF